MCNCKNHETINVDDGDTICGESNTINSNEPKDNNSKETASEHISESEKVNKSSEAETSPVYKKNNKKILTIIILISLLIINIILCITIILQGVIFNKAQVAADSGEYEKAIKYCTMLKFHKDASSLLKDSKYKQANAYIDDKKYNEALEALKELKDYKDTEKLKDYIKIKKNYLKENFVEALKGCKVLEDYRDVKTIIDELEEKIYSQAVDLYHNKEYENSKKLFNEIGDYEYKDTEKYLLLIKSHLGDLDYVSKLYNIIDFEDTKELLLSDDYICDFLMGKWSSGSKYKLRFYEDNKDKDKIWCEYSLPESESGEWYISDGIHYVSVKNKGDVKKWSYEIISQNDIKIHYFKNNKTYDFHRQ